MSLKFLLKSFLHNGSSLITCRAGEMDFKVMSHEKLKSIVGHHGWLTKTLF